MTDTELSRLPPAERIERYRDLATDSRRLAQSAITPSRQNFLLFVAYEWERLAADTEAYLARKKKSAMEKNRVRPERTPS